MRGVFVDQSHVEKAEDVNKDKKKRRRSNRRSKQNSSVSACGSVNELDAKPSEIVKSSGTLNEQHLPRACDVAFISLPTMHINEQAAPLEGRSMQNQQLNSSDYGGTVISKSCPETTACKESIGSYASKDCLLSHQICHQRNYFASHWSIESVNEALEVLLTEARVLGLGPRFMSIYVDKLAIEQRIYYDEVEELTVEWLDATSTLVLSLSTHKRFQRRGSPGKYRTLEDVALVTSPYELALDIPEDNCNKECAKGNIEQKSNCTNATEIEPAVFPLTVRPLSTIPVALHTVGGDDGSLDIGTRLYMSSYLVNLEFGSHTSCCN